MPETQARDQGIIITITTSYAQHQMAGSLPYRQYEGRLPTYSYPSPPTSQHLTVTVPINVTGRGRYDNSDPATGYHQKSPQVPHHVPAR